LHGLIVFTGKVDLGQGISDAVRAIVAEELDVAISRVEVQERITGAVPDEGYTVGSNSVEQSGEALRLAAATIRARVLREASRVLSVPIKSLVVCDGGFYSRFTREHTTYWRVMGGARFEIPVAREMAGKHSSDFSVIGRAQEAREIEGMVTGATRYLHDLRWNNMMHARVVRPPLYAAVLNNIPRELLRECSEKGIVVIIRGSFVAVAGAEEYEVVKARAKLRSKIQWTITENVETTDVFRMLRENDRVRMPVVDGVPRDAPVTEPEYSASEECTRIRATFTKSYIAHASLAPSAAAALMNGDRLSVWTHSQGIYPLRACLAEALDLDIEAVTVCHVGGSGCYGHNGADDAALDAALVAGELPGREILLKWTREDEHAWEPYGSAMLMRLEATSSSGGTSNSSTHETCSDSHIMRPFPGERLTQQSEI